MAVTHSFYNEVEESAKGGCVMSRARAWIRRQDELWFQYCNSRSEAAFIRFFQMLTHLGGARFTVVLQLVLMLAGPPSLFRPAAAASLSLGASHLAAVLIKRAVKRIRPFQVLPGVRVHGFRFKDHSFPSGHSTAAFSLAVPYSILFPPFAPALLAAAGLVALSRVVLGVHYPTDIAAGSLLGASAGIFFAAIAQSF